MLTDDTHIIASYSIRAQAGTRQIQCHNTCAINTRSSHIALCTHFTWLCIRDMLCAVKCDELCGLWSVCTGRAAQGAVRPGPRAGPHNSSNKTGQAGPGRAGPGRAGPGRAGPGQILKPAQFHFMALLTHNHNLATCNSQLASLKLYITGRYVLCSLYSVI